MAVRGAALVRGLLRFQAAAVGRAGLLTGPTDGAPEAEGIEESQEEQEADGAEHHHHHHGVHVHVVRPVVWEEWGGGQEAERGWGGGLVWLQRSQTNYWHDEMMSPPQPLNRRNRYI